MSEFEMPLGRQQTWECLDEFTQGYWEAAFFTNEDHVGGLTFADVAKVSYNRALTDCLRFQTENAALLAVAYAREDYSPVQAGRDYWFTRNGHGVGFWSREQLEWAGLGDKLSEASGRHALDLFADDNGKIHLEG